MECTNELPHYMLNDGQVCRSIYRDLTKELFISFHYTDENDFDKVGILRFEEVQSFEVGEHFDDIDEDALPGMGLLYSIQASDDSEPTEEQKKFLLLNGTPQLIKIFAKGFQVLETDFQIF